MSDKNTQSGQLSAAEAKALGESRESHCAVELKGDQSWTRKERKHSQEQFSSSVLKIYRPEYSPRCTFHPDVDESHKHRRHYAHRYENELKI